ncbi:MAG: c-type cytochrome biogenesis protein CcmI, partial [Alphaproteobacteria bacterium]|nr:c-type cytochrome biogenesis protein CcmI [Alphaproteobacteria bacterium]
MSLGLAIALIGLTSLALAILLVPLLLRRQTDLSRESYNIAVYRDQLAEVERDAGRGLIGAEQAEAARAEIGRRILALAPRSAVEPPKSSASFAVAAIAVLLLPFAAWLLYARLGMPGLPDEPFAERAPPAAKAVAGGAEHLDLGEAIAKIGAHLKEHPEDLTGWLLLARTQ